MNSRKLYFVLVSTTALLVLAVLGMAFGANEVLSMQAKELDELKAKSISMEKIQTNLIKNKANLVKYKDLNEIAKSIVPQDKDQAQTVGEITKIAEASGIPMLNSITFPASSLGAASSGAKAPITQLTPVVGMNGVYLLPITITSGTQQPVRYSQLIAFLEGLEQNRRTAQVSSLNLQPNKDNPDMISFTIVINEYIKP